MIIFQMVTLILFIFKCGSGAIGSAWPCQGQGCGFKSRLPLSNIQRIREAAYLTSLISWSLTKLGRGFESPIRNNIEVLPTNFLLIIIFSSWVRFIETWCNGSTSDFGSLSQSSNLYVSTILSYGVTVSTTDSGSVCLGSNPSSSTKNQKNIIKIFSKIKFMV